MFANISLSEERDVSDSVIAEPIALPANIDPHLSAG
jgi:hypothetical protein